MSEAQDYTQYKDDNCKGPHRHPQHDAEEEVRLPEYYL